MWIYSLLNDLCLQKSSFHRPQTLGYNNGYALAHRPTIGIGQEPLFSQALIQQEINELSLKIADFTDDSPDKTIQQDFIPAYVVLDKQVWSQQNNLKLI